MASNSKFLSKQKKVSYLLYCKELKLKGNILKIRQTPLISIFRLIAILPKKTVLKQELFCNKSKAKIKVMINPIALVVQFDSGGKENNILSETFPKVKLFFVYFTGLSLEEII